MEGWFARLLRAWVALLAGMGAGLVVGRWLGWPAAGSVAGAMAGMAVLVVVQMRRAARLTAWLRDPRGDAPRAGGLFGELAFRADKLVRGLQRQVSDEQQHLAQFLSAIQASPNGVLLLDPQDQIEWCNPVAAWHLGLDAERDLGQPVTNLVRMPGFVALLQAGPEGGAAQVSAPGRDGTLALTVRAYADDRRLVLTQDITDRLRQDTMRRDFVANVSHEIRSPLTVLAGFVETMATLPLTEVERQRVLTLMKQQTDRMQTLVSDLLALAQLEGSPRPPLDRWIPMESLFQRVQADAQALSGGRHLLHFDPVPDGAALAGTDTELLGAIGNLVSNAVRYTPEGGRIDVRWLPRVDGGAVIEVADTGIGIAREHLPRLAERFYRVDQSRSRDTGGTGLGLAIAKHAVQRHGGELDVDSEPGKGSRFRLLLPALRVRHAEPLPAHGTQAALH